MEKPPPKTAIRQYLLGNLTDAGLRSIEESFVLDPDYREEVLIAEDELIDDYLDGLLSEQERRRFDEHFLATPQQQQKLRIARSLKQYATSRPLAPSTENDVGLPHDTRPTRTGRWFNLRSPWILLPIAAGLLIVTSLGLLKLASLRREREALALEESRRTRIQQELTTINDSTAASGKRVFSLVLPAVSTRAVGTSRTINSTGGGDLFELQLVLSGQEHPSYRALLQKVDASDSFTISNLRVSNTSAGKVVPLRIPPDLLTRGTYRVQLIGVRANGADEALESYDFQLTENP